MKQFCSKKEKKERKETASLRLLKPSIKKLVQKINISITWRIWIRNCLLVFQNFWRDFFLVSKCVPSRQWNTVWCLYKSYSRALKRNNPFASSQWHTILVAQLNRIYENKVGNSTSKPRNINHKKIPYETNERKAVLW